MIKAPDNYTVGAIMRNTFGCEQTNVDFYRIEKRAGDWVNLQPLESITILDGPGKMTGRAIPAEPKKGKASLRRKLKRDSQGHVIGCAIESYSGGGWCRLWEGKPASFSTYA